MIHDLWDRFDPRHRLFCNTDGSDGGNQNDGGGNQNDGGGGGYSGAYGGNYNDPAGFGAGGTRADQSANDVAAYSAAAAGGTQGNFVGGDAGGLSTDGTPSGQFSTSGLADRQAAQAAASAGDTAGQAAGEGGYSGMSLGDIASMVGRALGISSTAAAADLANPGSPLGQIAQAAATQLKDQSRIIPGSNMPTNSVPGSGNQPSTTLPDLLGQAGGVMAPPGSPFDVSNISGGVPTFSPDTSTTIMDRLPPAPIDTPSTRPVQQGDPGTPFGVTVLPPGAQGDPGSPFDVSGVPGLGSGNFSPGVYSKTEQNLLDNWGGTLPGDYTTMDRLPPAPIDSGPPPAYPWGNGPGYQAPASPAAPPGYDWNNPPAPATPIAKPPLEVRHAPSPESNPPVPDDMMPGGGTGAPPAGTSGDRIQQGSAVLPGVSYQPLDMSQISKLAASGTVPLSQLVALAQQSGISLSGNALNALTGSSFGRGD